jgi:hypothetical protein
VVEGLDLDPIVKRGGQALEDLQIGDPVVDNGYGLTFHALSDPS